MQKNGFAVFLLLAVFAMLCVAQAHATAVLKLSDGLGNTVSITDNGTAICTGTVTGCTDANGATNVVTFVGTIGTWSLNVSTGSSHGALAGTALDLNSVNSTTAAGTLTVQFSDNGFTSPGFYNFQVGGTFAGTGTLTYQAFAGANEFDLTNQIGSNLVFTSSPFAGSANGAATGSALTEVATLAFAGAGGTSFDAQLMVPEPASLMLLGSGLLGVGALIRRKLLR